MSACWQALTSPLGNALTVPQSQALFHSLSYHYTSHATSITSGTSIVKVPSCSGTGLQEMSIEPIDPKSPSSQQSTQVTERMGKSHKGVAPKGKDQQDRDDDEEVGISRVQVPRQKHIPVSKSELLDAIISMMFKSDEQDDVHNFRLLTS